MTELAEPMQSAQDAPTGLLLNSLRIQNFRAFQDLQIEKLGRVNLIVGKNSVGKSSVLEALQLYANQGSLSTIVAVLLGRNEYKATRVRSSSQIEAHENMATSIKYLFSGRNNLSNLPVPIQIELLMSQTLS